MLAQKPRGLATIPVGAIIVTAVNKRRRVKRHGFALRRLKHDMCAIAGKGERGVNRLWMLNTKRL
jgi:hypothetical protein